MRGTLSTALSQGALRQGAPGAKQGHSPAAGQDQDGKAGTISELFHPKPVPRG